MQTVTPENTTLRTLPDEMWAEGMSNVEVTLTEVNQYLNTLGYVGSNLDNSWDSMQQVWRWSVDLTQHV